MGKEDPGLSRNQTRKNLSEKLNPTHIVHTPWLRVWVFQRDQGYRLTWGCAT